MAKAIIATTMNATYGPRDDGFAPAAAFDVIDLDRAKMSGDPRLHVCGTVA